MGWTECPRDKRNISTRQTGHVHVMIAVQKWGCPAEFLYVYCLFIFPICYNWTYSQSRHLSTTTIQTEVSTQTRRLKQHNDSSLEIFWCIFGVASAWGKESEGPKPRNPGKVSRSLRAPETSEVRRISLETVSTRTHLRTFRQNQEYC